MQQITNTWWIYDSGKDTIYCRASSPDSIVKSYHRLEDDLMKLYTKAVDEDVNNYQVRRHPIAGSYINFKNLYS